MSTYLDFVSVASRRFMKSLKLSEFLDLLENLEPVNRSEKFENETVETSNNVISKFLNNWSSQMARIAF